ncbi:MAG: hypothetical protein KO206_06510 [Methanomicrobiaceae archaeon]|uniref:Uncharacterized protein n=1 Tax=hydrocarbon metagenome TaxID=938273 RepID=A0A0W8FHH3_9ZZZZ|nr:hypothetical protein [Methanomicrobiaceae archaeon]MDD5418905.1 hypothetical protein [Methanomicrobiaceae archaeon]
MAVVPRAGLLVLFISVVLGFSAGAWAQDIWQNSIVSLLVTFAAVVLAYTAIASGLRAAGYPVE